jgi:hypothetical protein
LRTELIWRASAGPALRQRADAFGFFVPPDPAEGVFEAPPDEVVFDSVVEPPLFRFRLLPLPPQPANVTPEARRRPATAAMQPIIREAFTSRAIISEP